MSYRMKSLFVILMLVFVFLFTSCSKSEDTTIDDSKSVEKIEAVINEGIKSVEKVAVDTFRSTQLTDLMNEESEMIEQMSKQIIRCFTEHDKEGLKALFCQQVRNQPSFDDDIDKAIEYFKCDGYTTSQRDTSSGGGESWEDGKRVKWSVNPEIPYIAVLYDIDGDDSTNDMERRYYSIYYDWQIVDKEDPSVEGIQYMNIELLNIDNIEIGN